MRLTTVDEVAVLLSKYRRVTKRWEVQNASGSWKSLSALAVGALPAMNFVTGAQYGTDVDAPTWTGTLNLAPSRRAGGADISISPYVETSPANVDDADAPAPLIEGMRRIRGYATSSLIDGSLASEHKVFDGYVTAWGHKGPALSLTIADLGHRLLIAQIRDERVYDAGQLLETAIQQILDDNLGAESPTLVVDPSIAGLVTLSSKFKTQRDKVLTVIRNLALETVGANVRYMWDDDDEMRLRLFMPPRDKVTPDFEFHRGLYLKNPDFKENTDDIRNRGVIKFKSAATKSVVSIEYTVPDSIAKYRERYFEFIEDALSQVNTPEEATALITTAINDLAQPKAEAQFQGPFCWAADVYDLYNMVANDTQYTSDQQQGAMKLANTLGARDDATQFDTRGNIAGYSRKWIAVEGKGAAAPDNDDLAPSAGFYAEGSMYGGELFNGKPDGCGWIILRWGKTVRRIHVWARENLVGNPVVLWPPTSSDMYKAVTLDRPEGKTPREGNIVRASDGETVWEMMVPVPTTPGAKRAIIIQAEGEGGRLSKFERLSFVAADIVSDVADVVSWSITRIDATTIRYTWTAVAAVKLVAIMRDNIVIQWFADFAAGSSGPFTFDDEELHADKDYRCALVPFSAGMSGPRHVEFITAWTTTLAFAGATPDFVDTPTTDGPRVRINVTGAPAGTATVGVEKSVDSGQYDPWSEATRIPLAGFPYYDAVVRAGQFYRLVAYDGAGAVLDTSQPKYWTNPMGMGI